MARAVLTLNAGSSSIKFSLFEIGRPSSKLMSRGAVEGIGSAPHFIVYDAAGAVLTEQRWADPGQSFQSLLETILSWAEGHLGAGELVAVGHRVVHGGSIAIAPSW
jgi:acetate kinase